MPTTGSSHYRHRQDESVTLSPGEKEGGGEEDIEEEEGKERGDRAKAGVGGRDMLMIYHYMTITMSHDRDTM